MKSRFLFIGTISLLIFFLLSFHTGNTKESSLLNQDKSMTNNGWYAFDPGKKLDPKKVFKDHKELFGLSSDDEMTLIKESTTEIPNEVFYKFQQYYKGIKIPGAVMIVRSVDNVLELAHGKLFRNLNINVNPSLTEEKALNVALKSINADEYAWENAEWEAQKKIDENSPSATWYPKAELQISAMPGFKSINQAEFCLVYKFDISVSSQSLNYSVEVDAKTGDIVRCSPKILSANGTVNSVYNGQVNLTTYYRGFPNYDFVLQDRSRTNRIHTREFYRGGWQYCLPYNFLNNPELDDHDNFWHYGLYNNAASAHWAVSKAYEFYATQLYRTTGIREVSGYDIRVQVGFYPSPYEPAVTTFFQWGAGGDYINIGSFLGQDDFEGGLDVVGHEFTHGVAVFSAGLDEVYQYPAGPLTESFCDILGESVEYYVNDTCDYIMCSNFADEFKRCFNNPNTYRPYLLTLNFPSNECKATSYSTQLDGYYPTTYSELIEGYTSNTAHKNSAIQNRWFYLLANGDANLGVQGIGIVKAYKISYRTLMYHISGVYEDYPSCRLGTIQSAAEIYGQCSNEYKQVMNAWAAVGVGDPAPNPCVVPLTVSIYGPSYSTCGTCDYFTSEVTGGNGNYSYEWSVNYSSVSNSNQLYYCWPEYTSALYYITLTVTDGDQTAYANWETYVDCYTMLKETEDFTVSAYPNPVSNILTLTIRSQELSADNKCFVYIYDSHGKRIHSVMTKESEIQINVADYIVGTYYLTVIIKDRLSSIHFIKK